jgi:phytol kinase
MPGLLDTELLPDARTALLAALLALGSAPLLGYTVGRIWRAGVATAYTRKLFHIGIFSLAAGVHVTWGAPAVFVYGAVVALVVVYAVVRGEGYPFYEALARPGDAPHRTMFVLVPLATTALGGLASILAFREWAAVGYLVAGWGDALGEPVGARWGRHKYAVHSLAGVRAVRSLEGSLAVLFGGAIAAFTALLANGVSPAAAAGVGLVAGTVAALVEAISTHGLDNFTVQIAASGVAFLILS